MRYSSSSLIALQLCNQEDGNPSYKSMILNSGKLPYIHTRAVEPDFKNSNKKSDDQGVDALALVVILRCV